MISFNRPICIDADFFTIILIIEPGDNIQPVQEGAWNKNNDY